LVALSLCRYYWKAILRNKLEAAAQDAVAIKIESPARSLAAPRGDSIKIMRPASHCNNKTQSGAWQKETERENGLRALYSSRTHTTTNSSSQPTLIKNIKSFMGGINQTHTKALNQRTSIFYSSQMPVSQETNAEWRIHCARLCILYTFCL
jgi:hypothetical protein